MSRGSVPRDPAYAAQIALVLNNFIGTLHAARCTAAVWIPQTETQEHRHAVRFSLQMTFGAIAVTLRKFEDLWADDIPKLFRNRSERPREGLELVRESKRRQLRRAADELIAHYKDRQKRILTPTQVLKRVKDGGWETEEEIMAWVEFPISRLIAVRDVIMDRYEIRDLPQL